MLANNVPQEEFKERRMGCKKEAQKRGLSGLMIWSRGGGVFDRYADVDYLANHYQQRCYLPDYMPLWSGRSHCVLLIPVEGEPVLIVSSPEYNENLITVNDVRYDTDFASEICNSMKELGMIKGKIGILGSDVMTYNHFKQIDEILPNIELVESDDILTNSRMVKTPREIECIKEACRIGTEAIDIAMSNIAVGKTESQVIAPAIEKVISEGAALYFVVTSSGPYCNSAHSVDFPGYDGSRELKEGDIFRIDLIIAYEGYICDFGRSAIAGGEPTEQQKEMLDLVTDACEYVIETIKPDMSVKEICSLGDDYLVDRGVSLSPEQTDPSQIYAAYPPHWGHGIGMTWERPWLIEDEDVIFKPNMYLAVEKALYQPGVGTVSYEQNFLVTENGNITLTKSKKRWY